ncbi:MAG: hypothetical protein AB8C84_01815 [Oligoflexales bacterium]
MKRLAVLSIFVFWNALCFGQSNRASNSNQGEKKRSKRNTSIAQGNEAEALRVASSSMVRRFHEVLDELLAEFGYDVKTGQIKGLKNLAIRKVTVGETLPPSYKRYTQLLVSERIRENSSVRLIACTPCFSKTSTLVDGKIVITSPATNLNQLKMAADQLGIDYFMDVVLVYHSTHMVLAFQVFNVATNEMVWARTYNSETIRSRYQKLAIDYSQVEKSRPGEDYAPDYRLIVGVGGAGIPNVGGTSQDSSMLDVELRASERFDNRRSEFGMSLAIMMTVSSLAGNYTAAEGTGSTTTEEVDPDLEIPATPEPFTSALGIYGLYAHNFLGAVESYNDIRQGIHAGIGGLISPGYITGLLRFGTDIYLGRRFVISLSGLYILPSQVVVENEPVETKGGFGGSGVVAVNF